MENLAPKSPSSHRSEYDKISFLRCAEIRFVWARVTVRNVYANRLSFIAFSFLAPCKYLLGEKIKRRIPTDSQQREYVCDNEIFAEAFSAL